MLNEHNVTLHRLRAVLNAARITTTHDGPEQLSAFIEGIEAGIMLDQKERLIRSSLSTS